MAKNKETHGFLCRNKECGYVFKPRKRKRKLVCPRCKTPYWEKNNDDIKKGE